MSSPQAKIPVSPTERTQAEYLDWTKNTIQQPIVSAVLPGAIPALGQAFSTKLEAPERTAIENQFTNAKNQIYNTGVRGGALQSALTNQALQRANAVSSATNEAKQRGIERALGIVPSGFPGASSLLGAGGQLAGMGAQRSGLGAQLGFQQQQASRQQLGQAFGGLGNILGLFF